MSRTLLLAMSPGEVWGVRVEAAEPVALRIARAGAQSRVGELHLGRVVALRPELPAALVDIGLDRPAFLSAEDALPGSGIGGLHEGQAVLVQVIKDARADKAAGLTMRPRLSGRLLDLTPARPQVAAARRLDPQDRERLIGLMQAIAAPGDSSCGPRLPARPRPTSKTRPSG